MELREVGPGLSGARRGWWSSRCDRPGPSPPPSPTRIDGAVALEQRAAREEAGLVGEEHLVHRAVADADDPRPDRRAARRRAPARRTPAGRSTSRPSPGRRRARPNFAAALRLTTISSSRRGFGSRPASSSGRDEGAVQVGVGGRERAERPVSPAVPFTKIAGERELAGVGDLGEPLHRRVVDVVAADLGAEHEGVGRAGGGLVPGEGGVGAPGPGDRGERDARRRSRRAARGPRPPSTASASSRRRPEPRRPAATRFPAPRPWPHRGACPGRRNRRPAYRVRGVLAGAGGRARLAGAPAGAAYTFGAAGSRVCPGRRRSREMAAGPERVASHHRAGHRRGQGWRAPRHGHRVRRAERAGRRRCRRRHDPRGRHARDGRARLRRHAQGHHRGHGPPRRCGGADQAACARSSATCRG